MTTSLSTACTAFAGTSLFARGSLIDVALAVKAAGEPAGILLFDDASGKQIDLDLSGTTADVIERLRARLDPVSGGAGDAPRGRGRPRLGVIAREVTLLPRHWDWLAQQPGGASPALRRLVDAARKADDGQTDGRVRRERAYNFLSALAGNLPGYEEALRALFAGDDAGLARHMADWPAAVRAHALALAEADPPR